MDKFVALLAYLLSLFGAPLATSTFEQHLRSDGVDTLHARATVDSGVARFECLASRSRACHYRVYAGRCASPADAATRAACERRPGQRFTVAVGDSVQRTGLQHVRVCVSATPQAAVAPGDCSVLGGAERRVARASR